MRGVYIDHHRFDNDRCVYDRRTEIHMTATPPLAPDLEAPGTGRLQLALNVDDLDAAIDFYSRMFGVGPVKVKPGYANFAIASPPLKLVLFSGAGEPGTINHLGVEVATADEVGAAEQR